ncbi:Oca6 protein phosphatase [Candida orthopsilosis Co 90-125]|uniref:Oca6 protein phosphatase n=1 Tax=Candida orthopsilosis (strain 90-125) TaxID=1136231 RepID=H8X9R2_CANO9|nr:Oca6 protein phosphatase [Candida orthopsilosis Co 90-125]CCG24728.1 Oca6 protein phosphatase [Candida orthopsilosis Co 90-125]
MAMIPAAYIPPLRFNLVQPNLYRGAYPRQPNFKFLETLKLKTIISLTPEPITSETDPVFYQWAQEQSICLIHLECASGGKGKKRSVPLDYDLALTALNLMIHNKNQPIFIHCLNGGQITSLLVACLRKLQFWSAISIFSEFINFTTNITVNDRLFVTNFHGTVKISSKNKVPWLWVGVSKHLVMNHPKLKVIEIDDAQDGNINAEFVN